MEVNTDTDYFPSTSSGHRLTDALGSVRQLTSPTGNITYARAYDPYGVVTSTAGTTQTSYGYTDEFTSNEMVYLRARYYTPGMGRFLSKDPSSAESNLYLYARSNPVNFTDPTGYFSQSQIFHSFFVFEPTNWNTFLSIWERMEHKKWGFLAALLDANPGDRLEAYRYDQYLRQLRRRSANINSMNTA